MFQGHSKRQVETARNLQRSEAISGQLLTNSHILRGPSPFVASSDTSGIVTPVTDEKHCAEDRFLTDRNRAA